MDGRSRSIHLKKKKKSISKCVMDNKKTFLDLISNRKFHVIDPGFDRGRNAIDNDADDAEEPKKFCSGKQ